MYYKRSQLDALINRLRKRRQFITPAGVLVYVLGVLLMLGILYPREQVYSIIRATPVHDAFSVKYFENQLSAQPRDTAVRLALARTYLRGQQIGKLEQILPPLLESADPAVIREARFFDVFVFLYREGPRYRGEPEELHRIISKKISALSPTRAVITGQDAMFYADQAMGQSSLIPAAQLYLLGMELADDSRLRQRAYLKAVGALEQTGDVRMALRAAQSFVAQVPMDEHVAFQLLGLARKAERSDIARKYALILLSLESNAQK